MKLNRHPENPLLEKKPDNHWEAGSVFNANVLQEPDGLVRMFYRATNDIKRTEKGGYMSSIGYAESQDGVSFLRRPEPLMGPGADYEQGLGCEDARATRLPDGRTILLYTALPTLAFDSARIAAATTTDFKTIDRHGIVGPDITSKAACVFPEPINGRTLMLWSDHRSGSKIICCGFENPDQLLAPPEGYWDEVLSKLDDYRVELPDQGNLTEQETGAVPIRVDEGWLLIYSTQSKEPPLWAIGAAILDVEDPRKVRFAAPEPILRPETESERGGVVNNVVFPAGAAVRGDDLYVYYGSGDQGVCLATCRLDELLTYLRQHPTA